MRKGGASGPDRNGWGMKGWGATGRPAGGQGRRMLGLICGCAALALGQPGQTLAQQAAPTPPLGARTAPLAQDPPVQSPILTLNEELLYTDSLWGQQAEAGFEAEAASLGAENRNLEADLAAEERALTDRRPSMDPSAFRAEADAFDNKVTAIRAEQDMKARSLTRRRDAERRSFFAAILPALSEIMIRHGAVAILDARAIFVASNQIDVTEELLGLVDERLGAGPHGSSAGQGAAGQDAGREGDHSLQDPVAQDPVAQDPSGQDLPGEADAALPVDPPPLSPAIQVPTPRP